MPLELSRDARRWLRWGPETANLILIVMIGLSAARIFWLVWPLTKLPLTPTHTNTERARSDSARVNMNRIAQAHLFGEQKIAAHSAEQEKIINAPETHLNLVLTGIISDSSGRRSRALIKNAHNRQDGYSVGDTISRNVKLHAVYTNHVILDRSGHFETLTLESIKKASALAGEAREHAVSQALARELNTARRKILADPSTASQYIRLQPDRQHGNLIGYRIYPGHDKALFDEAGLKPGETVTSINGQPLNSPAASLKLVGNLAKAPSARITLDHNGQKRTITVNFQ